MADKDEFEAFLESLEASVKESFKELTWNQMIKIKNRLYDLYMKAWDAEIDKRFTAKQDPDYDDVWENWVGGGEGDDKEGEGLGDGARQEDGVGQEEGAGERAEEW